MGLGNPITGRLFGDRLTLFLSLHVLPFLRRAGRQVDLDGDMRLALHVHVDDRIEGHDDENDGGDTKPLLPGWYTILCID